MSLRRVLGLLLFLVLAFPACANSHISRETLPAPAPSSIATAAATVHASATSPPLPGPPAVIGEAYHDLLRELVLPIQPQQLLAGAWQAAIAEAKREGVTGLPLSFSSTGDSGAELASFLSAYVGLLQRGGSKLDRGRLANATLTGMAESVHDCHTAYLSQGQWQSVEADLQGQSSVDKLPIDFQLGPPFLITAVSIGSDADKLGVRPGDRITAFDGVPLSQVPLSQRKFFNAGSPGTTADLQLLGPEGSQRQVSLTREAEAVPVVQLRMIGAVGYLQVRTFTANLDTEIGQAIEGAQAQGAKGFVIDLRGNLGGELDTDLHLLSRFIPSGLLVTTSGPGEPMQALQASGMALPGPPPLAVLVDSGSLSASELFASDIQQFNAGQIVGTTTPGCLEGSTFRQLSDGSAIQITALKVQAGPGMVVVNGVGVTPNQIVQITARDLAAGKDPQLAAAVSGVEAQIRQPVSP